jgi:hypothetical protein
MKTLYEAEYGKIFETNCTVSKEIVHEFAGTYGTLWGIGDGTGRRFVLTVGTRFLESAVNLLSEVWGRV